MGGGNAGSEQTKARLAALGANAPHRSPNVRALAKYAATADCRLAALGFAAGVDFDRLLTGTRFAVPFGQSPFAFRRGNRFEEMLRDRGHKPLLGLLRDKLGFDAAASRVENLRDTAPRNRAGLAIRAQATEGHVRKMANGDKDALNLIDGAVLSREIGGVVAYFEADAVAARFDGPIHVGEVKSFPTVDGQADAEKVGAAIAQVSIYILLLRDLVERFGRSREIVSDEALIITPKNTGLQPTLFGKPVGREVDRARRILESAPSAGELVEALPSDGGTFGDIGRRSGRTEQQRLEAAEALAERMGTRYRPECLATCGLSRLCRERAYRSGDVACVGGNLPRLLPGVTSLDRAAELAKGARAKPEERPVQEQLLRAERLLELASTGTRKGGRS